MNQMDISDKTLHRMIEEGDPAVGEFLNYCATADIQHLRNLARNARRDVQKEKNTGQPRKLFRYLRECIDDAEATGN